MGKAPSDAVVLFNGRDMSGWTMPNGSPSKCTVADGVMTCRTGSGDAQSTERFRDAQIHVEFNVPYMPGQRGQGRGNSGILLQGQYGRLRDVAEGPDGAIYVTTSNQDGRGSRGVSRGEAAVLVNDRGHGDG